MYFELGRGLLEKNLESSLPSVTQNDAIDNHELVNSHHLWPLYVSVMPFANII